MKEYEITETKKNLEDATATQELALLGFQQKMKELAGQDLTAQTTLEQIKKYASAIEYISSWASFYAEKLVSLQNDTEE